MIVNVWIFQDMKTSFSLEMKILAYSEEFINELRRVHADVFSIFFRKDVIDQMRKSIKQVS